MIGNKCDLENDRVISKEQGQAAANELSGGRMGYQETSAKSNNNVTEVNTILLGQLSMKKTIYYKVETAFYFIFLHFRCFKKW